MKKALLSLSLLTLGFSLQAQTQLTNPSFETWEPYVLISEKPAAWTAGNVACHDENGSTTCTQNVNKVTDAMEGTYAAKVINFEAVDGQTGSTVLYTGSLMYIQDDMTQHPFTGRPVKLVGYYRFNQAVQADTVEAMVSLTGSGGSTDMIAFGYIAFGAQQTGYAQFEIPLMYMQQADPVSISVAFMFNEDASVNSDFTVDALNFDYTVTSVTPAESAAVSFYPNPASEEISFEGEVNSVVITSLQGKVVFSSTGQTSSVNVGNLEAGLYQLSYICNGQRINSKLVVK